MKFKMQLIGILMMLSSSLIHAEIVFEDLQGTRTSFSELKGKWVVLNYWAAWCPPCVAEIPEFNRFYKNNKKESVAIFGVNYDELPLAEQLQQTKQLNIRYPSLLKNPAYDLGLGSIRGIPVTFIFNPQGELVKTLYGPQTEKTLKRWVKL